MVGMAFPRRPVKDRPQDAVSTRIGRRPATDRLSCNNRAISWVGLGASATQNPPGFAEDNSLKGHPHGIGIGGMGERSLSRNAPLSDEVLQALVERLHPISRTHLHTRCEFFCAIGINEFCHAAGVDENFHRRKRRAGCGIDKPLTNYRS